MKLVIASLLAAAIALSSCASYRPLIDTKDSDMSRYEQDLAECQAYAQQQDPAASALVGAVIGAAFGVILAVVAGSNYDRGASAAVGAVSGAVAGTGRGMESQMDIIKNCLRGRGYRVLQ